MYPQWLYIKVALGTLPVAEGEMSSTALPSMYSAC